ncbi:MAG: hypothetical protein LBC74_02895 [Planctomycetaceae bacterium]|nr:hypothetical protein [Planctomycetaceae bacterium]
MSGSGPLDDELGEQYKGLWRIKIWTSDNLGVVPPQDSDFLIKLNPDTTIAGLDLKLKHSINEVSFSYFDLSKFTVEDLNIRYGLQLQKKLSVEYSWWDSTGRYIVIVLGIVMIIVALFLKVKNRIGNKNKG